MMPRRGALFTIARHLVYIRPDRGGASQSVGVSRQPHRNPDKNRGRSPGQPPSARSAMEPALIDPDGRGANLPAVTGARLVTRLVFPAGA